MLPLVAAFRLSRFKILELVNVMIYVYGINGNLACIEDWYCTELSMGTVESDLVFTICIGIADI